MKNTTVGHLVLQTVCLGVLLYDNQIYTLLLVLKHRQQTFGREKATFVAKVFVSFTWANTSLGAS